MVEHRLGQDEAYFTVREILAEASTATDGVLWREPSDFGRCGYATLGFHLSWIAPQFWISLQSLGKFFHFLLQFIDSALDLVQGCSHLLVLNGG